MRFNKKLLGDLLGFFFKGLLLAAPFALTIYIISLALNWIDGLIGLNIPGLGMVILGVSITFLGYIGSTLLVRSTFDLTESVIKKLPLVNIIYSSFKELLGAFVGNKKKFDQPVLITTDREKGVHKIGFVTQTDLKGMNLPDSVAVYVPHSYNFSGDLFILPKEAVTPIAISSAEITKFIVSGGVAGLKSLDEHKAEQVAPEGS